MDVNYRAEGQLHRYMDTDNIGYCRGTDGRSASKLILLDFDPATYHERTALPYNSAYGFASVANVPEVRAREYDQNRDLLTDRPGRLGSASFMAIEAIESDSTASNHELHEMESITCVLLWHSVGYRPRCKTLPRHCRSPRCVGNNRIISQVGR